MGHNTPHSGHLNFLRTLLDTDQKVKVIGLCLQPPKYDHYFSCTNLLAPHRSLIRSDRDTILAASHRLLKMELVFRMSLTLTPQDAHQSPAAPHGWQVGRSPRGPSLGQPPKRRELAGWAGSHPPATALAPVSRENVDKVLHLNFPHRSGFC